MATQARHRDLRNEDINHSSLHLCQRVWAASCPHECRSRRFQMPSYKNMRTPILNNHNIPPSSKFIWFAQADGWSRLSFASPSWPAFYPVLRLPPDVPFPLPLPLLSLVSTLECLAVRGQALDLLSSTLVFTNTVLLLCPTRQDQFQCSPNLRSSARSSCTQVLQAACLALHLGRFIRLFHFFCFRLGQQNRQLCGFLRVLLSSIDLLLQCLSCCEPTLVRREALSSCLLEQFCSGTLISVFPH